MKRLRGTLKLKLPSRYKLLNDASIQDHGDTALGQHGHTRAQLQDVLRLEHSQGGGLHQHREEAVRELSRDVSEVMTLASDWSMTRGSVC